MQVCEWKYLKTDVVEEYVLASIGIDKGVNIVREIASTIYDLNFRPKRTT